MSVTFDVDRLVDEQKIDRFNVMVVGLSFLAMLADGYELTALAFAAPELVRLWGVDTSSLGMVFTASLFGILVGAPLLGSAGDRFGRRVAILIACFICGFSTLAMVLASNLEQMFALRFVAGIGIGGLMPNTIALTSELSPRRHRAMMIVLMFVGITIGSGLPSLIAAELVPRYGWQVLFLIGGIFPLLVAAVLAVWLPESVKFLLTRDDRRADLVRVTRRMRPDMEVPEDAVFHSATADSAPGANRFRQVFAGGLRWITPLIWLCFAATLMSNFFLNSWMPVLFERTGMTPEDAALASGLYHVGGTLGGLMISMLIDRCGICVVAVFLGIAAPAVAAIGIETLPDGAILVLAMVAGVGVLGAQFGNNASAALIYPTAVRAKAVGLAFSIGRFGSIFGPLVGGYVLANNYPMDQLFRVAAIPLLVAMAAALMLTRLCWLRYNGFRLRDMPTLSEAGSAVGS